MSGSKILVAGDSHVRFWSGHDTLEDVPSVFDGIDILWVGAATAFHAATPNSSNQAQAKILQHLDKSEGRYGCVILSFGEIDCRAHILRQAILNGSTIGEEVGRVIDRYSGLVDQILRYDIPVLQWGPPPTGGSVSYNPEQPLVGTVFERNLVTQEFNRQIIGLESSRPHFKFFTIFAKYVDASLRTVPDCFIDGCHLSNVCLPDGEAALRSALRAIDRTDLLTALERELQVAITSVLRNIADGAPYQLSSIEPGTVVTPFRGSPTAGYKFHTTLEINPWLLMDFGAAFLIRKITVYNRSDFCQDRAETLQIEASVDGANFVTLYAPERTVFKGVWAGKPLSVEIQSPHFYRYLRFSLRAETYFHLEAIQVFAPSFEASRPPAQAFAQRTQQPLVQDNGTIRPINILYFSCHEILEYDDLAMFTSRNHRVFSLGTFTGPGVTSRFRPAQPAFFHPGDWENFVAMGCSNHAKTVTAEFASQFDVVIINHYPHWIEANLNALHGIPILYRSIGQSTAESEAQLRRFQTRLSIIRYSERETSLPGFLPSDGVIYFGKQLPDRPVWNGGSRIVTFHNDYTTRSSISAPDPSEYVWLARQLEMDFYGAGNDDLPFSRGLADAEQQRQLYADAAAYFYVYSTPPSYTLSFMEALATGAPIVAPSSRFLEQRFGDFDSARYEVPQLLGNDDRVLYDTIGEALEKLTCLLASPEMGRAISAQNFAMAQQRFDAAKIAAQWEQTLVRLISAD